MNTYDRFDTVDLPLFDSFLPENPSMAAKESIRDKLPELRRKVFDYLASRGETGATDEEMQDGLAMPPNTQRPRRHELMKAGRVVDSGRRRILKSGKSGTVWVVRA